MQQQSPHRFRFPTHIFFSRPAANRIAASPSLLRIMLFHFPSRLPSIYEPCSEPTSPLLIDCKSSGTRVTTSPHETLSAAFPAAAHRPFSDPAGLVTLRYRTCRRVSFIPPESSYIMSISHPRSCLPIPPSWLAREVIK